MEKKNAVIREAEEIIEHYIKKQQGIARHFHKKSKRRNPKGIGLLLCLGGSLLVWGLLIWWIF